MIPSLRATAAATEKARRVSRETILEMGNAELFRSFQPVRFGGFGHDYGMMIDVGFELSRGCASTGWNYAVLSAGSYLVTTMFSP